MTNPIEQARAAKAKADAARVEDDRTRWIEWRAWCLTTAAALRALRTARSYNEGVDEAYRAYCDTVKAIPPLPRYSKPEDL